MAPVGAKYYSCSEIVQALGNRVFPDSRAALVAGLRRQIRLDVRPRHELQAGVRLRRRDEAAAVPVEKELLDRDEALQVGLLVDREVETAARDRLERPRQQVVAPGPDA